MSSASHAIPSEGTPRPAPADAASSYAAGGYWRDQHAEWLTTPPTKQLDLLDGLLAAVDASGKRELRLADVGAGTGWCTVEAVKLVHEARPGVRITPVCYEIAPDAVAVSRRKFPDLDMRQKHFDPADGPFDLVMLVDVLEHLENPWKMLRDARACGEFLVVRQPLLTCLSTFRHNAYRSQRETLGHIAFFDARQFKDMALACGWAPVRLDLLAPWEWPMHRGARKAAWWKRVLVNRRRELMSYMMSGFYLNGALRGV